MMHMDNKALDKLLCSQLHGILIENQAFVFLRGMYYRDLPSKVRHVLIIDYNRKKGVFYIIVGLNSPLITGDGPPDEAGVYVSAYLSPGGIVGTPVPYKAYNLVSIEKSLEMVRFAIEAYALPWFNKVQSLSDMAALLGKEYDFLKGKLLFEAGDFPAAKHWFKEYEKRLVLMPVSPEVVATLQTTRDFIDKCSA
jgi:hypothetical protein